MNQGLEVPKKGEDKNKDKKKDKTKTKTKAKNDVGKGLDGVCGESRIRSSKQVPSEEFGFLNSNNLAALYVES